ncbi:hypothetical protein CAL26_08190 [Bordetella genomosp. 9]|uniref:Uncharacterized protein n=1 Tax=Bordetella genomosp. 9 TaxID=1416803 RepID=A0A261RER0_9BORD|nr:TadE family protein [Bordetella genomosp. 9]OZI23421.1 hypothetical protein CAL26_08190 [Bordetella genomosp. 9]
MHPPISRAAARQRGAAIVAFTVSALPLLFCGLLVVEAARWHMTRQMLDLALLEAARAGATGHARPATIEQAFETALLPLFHPPGRHRDPRARMRASFLHVTQQTGAPPWRIDVTSPSVGAYADFGDASLRIPAARGLPTIRNDYQAEQHLRRRRMGWPGGRGPRSGQTVFEANMLRLRLAYAHAPWVPGVRALLRRLAALRGSGDPAARAGMLVMEMEMALPMQSHPVLWHASAAGVGRPVNAVGAAGAARGARPAETAGAAGADREVAGARTHVGPVGLRTPTRRPRPGPDEMDISAPERRDAGAGPLLPDGSDGPIDDPACGVLLCCAPVGNGDGLA